MVDVGDDAPSFSLPNQDGETISLADLKGKRVVIGPAGAGFEMFVGPIMEAHGVKLSDVKVVNATQGASVDALKDQAADAAFLGGAVPTNAIVNAFNSFDPT